MEFPTIDKFAKDVAEKVLDEFIYEGKTIREWVELLAKQQPCEDCISRQALIEKATSWDKHFADSERCVSLTDIQNAPSVTPQPKIGRWIKKDGFDGDEYYDCSECGESFCLIDGTPTDNLYNYCPNCGAKLTELKPN